MVEMHQLAGDHATNIQINGSVAAPLTVHATGSSRLSEIKLSPNASNAIRVTEAQLRRSARPGFIGLALMVASGVSGIIAVLANTLDIGEKLGINLTPIMKFWWTPPVVLLFAGILLASYNIKAWGRYRHRPYVREEAVYLGDGQFIEIDDDGQSWWQYSHSAPCIYPHCSGFIKVVNAPPRERQLRQRIFVGVCNKWGKEHSYRLDGELVATPFADMDWRALEPTPSHT